MRSAGLTSTYIKDINEGLGDEEVAREVVRDEYESHTIPNLVS